jgi:hypothetical protein
MYPISQVFHVFLLLLYTLSFRLGEGRQQSGITSLQRTLGFIPVLVLISLEGFRVSRSNFSIEDEGVKPRIGGSTMNAKCRASILHS